MTTVICCASHGLLHRVLFFIRNGHQAHFVTDVLLDDTPCRELSPPHSWTRPLSAKPWERPLGREPWNQPRFFFLLLKTATPGATVHCSGAEALFPVPGDGHLVL